MKELPPVERPQRKTDDEETEEKPDGTGDVEEEDIDGDQEEDPDDIPADEEEIGEKVPLPEELDEDVQLPSPPSLEEPPDIPPFDESLLGTA
jgi:hypothetical protein